MAFELEKVVPWGRNFMEYKNMFVLTRTELDKKIISFGDGPASFNCEMNAMNRRVVSLDPVYRYSEKDLRQRIKESAKQVIEQARQNMDNFIWKNIKTVEELEEVRMNAMHLFLEDFEQGKEQGRYISHELPYNTGFFDNEFDIGLSSHFLILYSNLGLDFHIKCIIEMLRICKEVRIFPLVNLDAKESEVKDGITRYFNDKYLVEVVRVNYEFQKNGNRMLKIAHKK